MTKRATTTGLICVIAVLPCALSAAEPAGQAAPAQGAAGADVRSRAAERTLALEAPEIGRIFSLAQINAVLSRAVDPTLERVEVKALPLGDLPLEDNGASPAESIVRTIAWLFMPTPTATFAATANATPDATYSHRPEPFLQASYHASFGQP